jgi:transposase
LEHGKFHWPSDNSSIPLKITRRELRWLLDGLSLEQNQAHTEVTARTVL